VNQPPELRESTDRYYTAYYRDTLGIPGWSALVRLRREEEVQERARRLARLEALLGADALQGRVLNVGCGTGGFNAAAAAAGVRVAGVDAGADAIAICALRPRVGLGFARAAAESLPFSDGVFDVVHCFSVIEHVASVTATIRAVVLLRGALQAPVGAVSAAAARACLPSAPRAPGRLSGDAPPADPRRHRARVHRGGRDRAHVL